MRVCENSMSIYICIDKFPFSLIPWGAIGAPTNWVKNRKNLEKMGMLNGSAIFFPEKYLYYRSIIGLSGSRISNFGVPSAENAHKIFL